MTEVIDLKVFDPSRPHVPKAGTATRLLLALALCLSLWGALPSAAQAQALRVESIAQEQRAKADSLGLEGPSKLEKAMVRVSELPLFGKSSGPYPSVDNIYPGTGLAFGATYVRRWPRNNHLKLIGGLAIKGSTLVELDGRMPEISGGRLEVDLNVRRMVAKELLFYGLGPGSSPGIPLGYDYRSTTIGAIVALHPARWVEFSVGCEWLTLKSIYDAPISLVEAPGFGQELSYGVVQASAALDWRTSPGYSTRGGYHRLTWSNYAETQDRPFQFHQLDYEGIQLVPILREQWVLAFRFLTTLSVAEDGDGVPVVLAPTLGGAETLRGFRTRRFSDLNRILITGEYRWQPSRFLEMALFYDAGSVAAQRRDLQLSEMERDWGIGVRLHGPTWMAFGTEVAKGREGWMVVFSGGTGF